MLQIIHFAEKYYMHVSLFKNNILTSDVGIGLASTAFARLLSPLHFSNVRLFILLYNNQVIVSRVQVNC